jgi:hypothetical protein
MLENSRSDRNEPKRPACFQNASQPASLDRADVVISETGNQIIFRIEFCNAVFRLNNGVGAAASGELKHHRQDRNS